MTGELTFAFVAGTVATANPCGFAMLPAYLARQLSGRDETRRAGPDAIARALLVGAVTTAGFLVVFGVLGTAITLGARWVTEVIPWIALAIGTALILAGIAVLTGRRIGPRTTIRAPQSNEGYRSVLLFGLAYGVASLSCTLPIFLVVVGTAITGDALTGALMSAAYAAGMGTILTALAVAAVLSRSGLATAIRRALPYISRLSALLLMAAGTYVVYYWAVALFGPSGTTGTSKPIDIASKLSSTMQTWLGGGIGKIVSIVLLAALVVIAAWAAWPRVGRLSRRDDGERLAPIDTGVPTVRQPSSERPSVQATHDR